MNPFNVTLSAAEKARLAAEFDTQESTGHFKRMQQGLMALNRRGGHIYAGTVPAHVVEKRRARNRAARKSRRANRR